MTGSRGKPAEDPFKIDVECHVGAPVSDVSYFPNLQRYKRGVPGLRRAMYGPPGGPASRLYGGTSRFWETWGEEGLPTPEQLIQAMDKLGVDMACLLPESFMELFDYSQKMSSNGLVARMCEEYPDRFIFQPNVGPLKKRGMKAVLWELEYLVKERNAKLVKFYPPEDTYINDPEIWPFYQKASDLGIPVTIHTGANWPAFGLSKYAQPILLEEVVNDFPDLKIIAFHFGWPDHHYLNVIAMKHPNVYISTTFTGMWAVSAPRKFAELIGEAIRFVGPDRIVWGTDLLYDAETRLRMAVEGFKNFQIPSDMIDGYGYEPLTDEVKRMIFGENLAKLLNLDTKRRVEH